MSTYSELDSIFFAWYEQVRNSNIPVNKNILQEKALGIAASNSMNTFSGSNEWISRFKIHHSNDDNADE
ncbi:hypothetical protein NPIL_380201, partial [Nephila pilipes]